VKPVFVDTSAILALLVADDPNHAAAAGLPRFESPRKLA